MQNGGDYTTKIKCVISNLYTKTFTKGAASKYFYRIFVSTLYTIVVRSS